MHPNSPHYHRNVNNQQLKLFKSEKESKPSNMVKKDNSIQSNKEMWKIALVLLCGGLICFGYFYPEISNTNLVFVIRYKLPLILIISLFFYVSVVRNHGAKTVSFSFLTILIFAVVSSLTGFAQLEKEEELAFEEIKKEAAVIIDSSFDSEGTIKPIERTIDATPKARGIYGEIEYIYKLFMGQQVALRNEYINEMESLNVFEILDARHLEADEKLIESKERIQKAQKTINNYQEKYGTALVKVKESISLLKTRENFIHIEAVKIGMLKALENVEIKVDEQFRVERKAFDELENIVKFLSTRNGAWSAQGDQIIFYEDNDLKRYQTYIDSLQHLGEIQRKNIEDFQDKRK